MSIISYPQTVSQTTGGKYATFDSLTNIKVNVSGKHAITKLIKSKSSSPNRPSTVSATNFKLNLPTGAKVTSVKVEYRHDLQPYNSKYPSINAPTISLLGVSGYSVKGKAPNKNLTTRSVTFKPKKSTDFSSAKLNSKDFGVQINYPTNTNTNSGYLRIAFVRVTVEYKSPSYTLSWSCNPKQPEQDGKVNVTLKCSNKNLTDYTPTVTVTTPAGFTLTDVAAFSNSWVKVNNRTYLWKPKFSSKVGSLAVGMSFDVNVSGALPVSSTFEAVESLTGATGSLTVQVVEETPDSSSEEGDGKQSFDDDDAIPEVSPMVWGVLNTAFKLNFEFTEEEIERYKDGVGQMPLKFMAYSENGTLSRNWYYSNKNNVTVGRLDNGTWSNSYEEDNYVYENYFKVLNNIGVYILKCYASVGGSVSSGAVVELVRELKIYIKPQESSLSVPFMSLLQPTTEETNRLGDGYSYILQSNLQLNTEEEYIRDWYKNFRLGVFNNRIEENCTSTLDYYTTDETTNTTVNIPISIDTETHNTIRVTASDIVLTIDETDYTFNSEETKTIQINTNSFIAVATKNTSDNTSYTVEIEDYTKTYNIQFNAEENKTEEVIHDTTDYNTLTKEDIFKNAEYWSTNQAGLNTYNNIECDFTYNKNYPLYLLITGDYPEGNPNNNTIQYYEPCIIETDVYTNRETNGNYPEPIENVINHEGDTASTTIPVMETSTPIVIYNLDLDEDYGTDTTTSIRGIGVTITIDDYNDCVISAQLKAPNGTVGERSVILEDEMLDEENTLTIGGIGDLWNFNTLDITNLKDWEVIITKQNILTNTETTITSGNTQLVFYIEQINEQKDYCYINGEDIRYYGAFISDIDIPSGLNTDTNYLDVDGTDINDPYRQNIREKEITIEFEIGDNCDLQTATDTLRQITQLILNERDQYNRPIPKTIQFSFMPDVYFEYIVEDTFDNPLEISSYNVKAKLTVPAGTSYKVQSTTTNTTGNVQGLAKVNPIISIKPTGTEIEVTETNTGQKFTIHYTGDTTDEIIIIDTASRKCYLQTDEDSTERTDITNYVDFNSDWFILQGAYVFTGTNCYIRTVEYTERW